MNKNVLSSVLKLSMFGTFLISRGKLFHKFGAATIKDLSPNVLLERNLYLQYRSNVSYHRRALCESRRALQESRRALQESRRALQESRRALQESRSAR